MFGKIGLIVSLLIFSITGFFRSNLIPAVKTEDSQISNVKTDTKSGRDVLGSQYSNKPNIYISNTEGYGAGGVIPLTINEEPAVNVNSYNIEGTATVEIYSANVDQMLSYLLHDKDGKQRIKSVDSTGLTKLSSIQLSINSKSQSETRFLLPIGDKEHGIWFIKLSLGKTVTDSYVVRSGFGVMVKEGDNDLVYWGQDYQTRKSIIGGKLSVYSLLNERKELTNSDFSGDGVTTTPVSAEADLAIATIGDDISLIPINLKYLNTGYSYTSFGPKVKKTKYFVFTDRPIYKPDDTIYFKSIIRDDNDAVYSLQEGIAKVSVYKDWDEKQTIFEKTYSITSDGTVFGEIRLPSDAQIGDYTLKVSIPNTGSAAENYWEDNTTYFQVQYFRKPEFGIDIEAPKTEIISGDPLSFTITGNYFSGQPLSGSVSYKISTANYWDYDYYSDTSYQLSDDYGYGFWGDKKIQENTAVFDSQGRAVIDLVYKNPSDTLKSQVVSIEATYDNGSGNPSFARKNILVYSGLYAIYRKDTWRSAQVGKSFDMPMVLVGRRGTPVNGIDLTVKATRESWIPYHPENQKYLSYRKETEDLGQVKIKTDGKGEVIYSLNPAKPGSYLIEVSGNDKLGNVIRHTFYKWVTVNEEPFYGGAEGNDLRVESDREKYNPGETATITVSSTTAGRDVFMAIERGWVRRYQIVHLTGKTENVTLPLVDTDIPNVYVSVVSFGTDSVDTGNIKLPVAATSKKIITQIIPDRSSYGPGANITVNIQTSDISGNPVSADTALWAVDKAIFELVDQQNNDIFSKFWSERYDNTGFSHSLAGITVRTSEMGGCFGVGTKIKMASGAEIPIENIKPGDQVMTRTSESNGTLISVIVKSVSHIEENGFLIINGTLKVTPDHYLWINGKWNVAANINIKDSLTGLRGENVPVTSIEWFRGKIPVYNLEIENKHTFFADGVWVHNQKGGGGGRSVFKDTAYWNPSVKTNSEGKAQVTFKLPDNLTTWVMAAVSANPSTQVGNTLKEIMVTKDVIIRPILPNVVRIGDTLTLKAIVQNFTQKDRQFNIQLSSDNLTIENPLVSNIAISAKGSQEVSFNVKPSVEKASSKLTYSVIANDDKNLNDQVTVELPILEFGFKDRQVLAGNGSVDFPVNLDSDADKTKSKLSLSLSPTITGSLVPAMKYLVNYPYGCIEQTTSRFVPSVIAKLNPNLYGNTIADKNIDEILKKGITRITELQQPNGGWTWWYQGPSNEFVSAYVVEYLLMAKTAGVTVNENTLSQARDYFKLINPSNTNATNKKETEVIRVYAQGLFGEKSNTRLTYHENNDNSLSPDILAYEVMANVKNGFTNSSESGLDKLLTIAKVQGDTLYWESGSKQFFGSRDATTALVIRAILVGNGPREMGVKAANYLMRNRKFDYWSNTFATSQVVRALTDLAKTGNEDSPDYTYEVVLDGKTLDSGKISSISQKISDITIPLASVKTDGSNLKVIKNGNGQLYSIMSLDEFRTDRKAVSESNGLTVTRDYINEKGSQYGIAVGDTVEVRITIGGIAGEEYYGVIEDELPSGLIPVNEAMKNEQYGNNYSNYYNYWGVNDREYTQNGAILSAYRFGGGTRTYTYRARAVTEGVYIAPPAFSSLMYAPEINGRSGVQTVSINKYSTDNSGQTSSINQSVDKSKLTRLQIIKIAVIVLIVFLLIDVVIILLLITPIRKKIFDRLAKIRQFILSKRNLHKPHGSEKNNPPVKF
jgi:alpha-2-macroglobulin